MKKTILIGALLLGTLAQANMENCVSAVDKIGVAISKGIKD